MLYVQCNSLGKMAEKCTSAKSAGQKRSCEIDTFGNMYYVSNVILFHEIQMVKKYKRYRKNKKTEIKHCKQLKTLHSRLDWHYL